MVHGDGFAVPSWETQLDWFWDKIQKRFESKHRGRLGPSRNDTKQIRILNRIVEWTDAGILYEGDQRHVEICIRQMGLEESAREVVTPVDRSVEDPRNADSLRMNQQQSQALSASAATMYRGMTARLNYLGQEGSEIQLAVKELGKGYEQSQTRQLVEAEEITEVPRGQS